MYVQFHGVWRVRRDPRFGQRQNVEPQVGDHVVDMGVADLLLRTAKFNQDLGPGLRSTPADSSSSRTTTPDRHRGGIGRYTNPDA